MIIARVITDCRIFITPKGLKVEMKKKIATTDMLPQESGSFGAANAVMHRKQ